jgi:hypothetical protein
MKCKLQTGLQTRAAKTAKCKFGAKFKAKTKNEKNQMPKTGKAKPKN